MILDIWPTFIETYFYSRVYLLFWERGMIASDKNDAFQAGLLLWGSADRARILSTCEGWSFFLPVLFRFFGAVDTGSIRN